MASNQLPPSFILTPQQQELLFAALNSNNTSASPRNSGMSMSPNALDQSPHQSTDHSSVQDTPFLDYDLSFNPDSSYDFDLSGFDGDTTQGQMIGDLPGASPTKSEPTSPSQAEKRDRPDDGDGEPENGPKRRESTDKVPKKPGRKPLTSEPSSKRKAQNRAAQRAFRERKEKHLKDLETKVEELQKASESANHENERLRTQIEKLNTELREYKKRMSLISNTPSAPRGSGFQWGSAAVNNLNDINFHFEFPKFGALPGPNLAASSNGNQRSSSVTSMDSQTSPKTSSIARLSASGTAVGHSKSQSADDFSSLNGLFGSTFGNNAMGGGGSGSLASLDSANYNIGATTTSSPSASSSSNAGPSSSCGTSPEPFSQSPMGFKPVDTLTTIGEETSSQSNANTNSSLGRGLDLGNFDWVATQNGGSFDPQLFGNYREPQENILSNGFDDMGFFNDAYDLDFLTPYNVPESVVENKKDILAELDAKKMEDDPLALKKPANFSGQLLTCTKIWEKLQNCPKVQNADIDLDSLCKDLKDKAKCTGNGPMVDEKDFKEVIQKYVQVDCATEALSLTKEPSKQP